MFGYASNATIENLSTSGFVKGGDTALGGIVGYATNGTILRHVHTSAIVEGSDYIGGVAGRLRNGSQIIDSSASGNIKIRFSNGGGLAGWAENSTTERSFATGNNTSD